MSFKSDLSNYLNDLTKARNDMVERLKNGKDKVVLSRMIRFGFISTLIPLIFWLPWRMVIGPVPALTMVPGEAGWVDLPFSISGWWLLPYFFLLSAGIVNDLSSRNCRFNKREALYAFILKPLAAIIIFFLVYTGAVFLDKILTIPNSEVSIKICGFVGLFLGIVVLIFFKESKIFLEDDGRLISFLGNKILLLFCFVGACLGVLVNAGQPWGNQLLSSIIFFASFVISIFPMMVIVFCAVLFPLFALLIFIEKIVRIMLLKDIGK